MSKNNNINDYQRENIIISFSPFSFCFRSCSINGFTNYLKDDEEFHENLKLLTSFVMPHLVQYTLNDLLAKKERHTHTLDSKHIELAKEIVKELKIQEKGQDFDFDQFCDNNINDYTLWQLGTSYGIRMICTQHKNIFYVLFMDYHHQMYPDVKYNQLDYSKYSFCPIEYRK